MKTVVLKAGTDERSTSRASAAGVEALKAGKLVAFATETVYGVGAIATNQAAMERLRVLKDRPQRPFSVHVGHPGEVARYVRDVPAQAERLIRRAWPGPVTILMGTGGRLADDELEKAGLRGVLCHQDVIGLRCPAVTVTAEMLAAAGLPVSATSANRAGRPSPRNAGDVLADLDGKIDLLIDSGPTLYGRDSTIVHFGADGLTVVRQGVLDEQAVRKLAGLNLLFVCSGNTCRSPIAEGVARKLLAELHRCRQEDLGRLGVGVSSAGTGAFDGQSASPHAVGAAGRLGADISGHSSRFLTDELINAADLVFCMTQSHVEQTRQLAPAAAGKIIRLDPRADVLDPVGGGVELYDRTARQIEQALRTRMEKGLP
ncbi:MAG: threonylcarbamoyl-AMP synthase [Planctomycetes bacterium]|nr:threonylcarbamoyl-AMP synthase [Planctomycetota bacterium]